MVADMTRPVNAIDALDNTKDIATIRQKLETICLYNDDVMKINQTWPKDRCYLQNQKRTLKKLLVLCITSEIQNTKFITNQFSNFIELYKEFVTLTTDMKFYLHI